MYMTPHATRKYLIFQLVSVSEQTGLESYFACADPESFVRGDPIFSTFFLADDGSEDPNTTNSGPSTACQ